MKIDTYYKFIASTFGIAYFVGLVIGILLTIGGTDVAPETNITNSFFLQSTVNFRALFIETINLSFTQAAIPFTYLIVSVKYGLNHAFLLTSPFLGQIKLFVQLIPQVFYFISFILFATIGLKLIIYLIVKLANLVFEKTKRNIFLKLNPFNKNDPLFLYLALLFIITGVFIQIFLSKIFFIFLINFQLVSYVFIIILYILLITTSLYLVYSTIKSALEEIKNIYKKIIFK
ncbi:MAG: hypothetical protein PHU47_00125 [Candidatus ainarchaeum sp.]|nr:hypothetical protein [Candidatus ainarchaeum sp.]